MERNIIQHHPAIDFDEYFRNLNQGFVGIDYNDYQTFFKEGATTHSFIGIADGAGRVKLAINDAIGSPEASVLLANASSLMLVLHHSPKSEKPLTTEEMLAVSEFTNGLPEKCDIVWSLANDETLVDVVKILVLASIKSDTLSFLPNPNEQ